MYVYILKNFAFFHQWKCGGTSVYATLRSNVGHATVHFGDDGAVPAHLRIDRIGPRKLSVHSKLETFMGQMELYGILSTNIDIYTNIRDPLDRMVSAWAWCKRTGHRWAKDDFHEWFNEQAPTFRWQSDYMVINGEILPSNLHAIRLEDEAEHRWPEIWKRHFDLDLPFPYLNTSSHPQSREIMTDDEIGYVVEHEPLLYGRFGYEV